MSANLKPGEQAEVPTTIAGLLIEALRTANRVCGAITEIGSIATAELDDQIDARAALERIHAIAIRQFSDLSGVHLFIAANNLGLDLPADLRGEPDDPEFGGLADDDGARS